MVQTSHHGGSCCGMRHIWQFRYSNTEQYIQDLIREMNRGNLADERFQLEVILSDRQTRENPALVDALARLGYVYTSSWTGGHGTPVHLFLRAKRRLALSAANFYNRWVNDNNGMLPHPDLAGELPRFEEGTAVNNRNGRSRGLEVGVRVENVIPRGARRGQFAVVRRAYDGFDYQIQYELDGHTSTFSSPESVRIVEQPVQEPVQPPAPRAYRHPTNPAGWPEPAQAPVPERRLILSQFYCVFRNTGQASRVFPNLLDGQAAYPNARDWHERKIYSDGEIVEGPVQHG